MRTETRTLYTYDELAEGAQERARDDARRAGWYGDDWDDAWRDTLTNACEAFGLTADSWEVSICGPAHCRVTMPNGDVAGLRGVRAWKYAHARDWDAYVGGDCPFTGYCGDESFLDPLRAFLERPALGVTLGEVLQDCADAWVAGWVADMEFQQSDEYVADDLEVNGHEFTKDGVRV